MKKYRYVNFVFGTHNIHRLPYILGEVYKTKKQVIEVYSKEGNIVEGIPVKRENRFKAFVNIMYGCDKFCTYCIVPFTRGKQRSRNKDDIIKEVNKLVKEGYQEVTLLGQNVNAYGKDLNNDYKMEDLLRDVAKTGIPRIRFMTSHPWDFTDGMIDVIKEYDNIMPSVHLPVQSGSSKVLKLMGRRYTKEDYITLFDKLRTIPNVTISTDIIVGFPSETEEDFNETLELVNYCKFDNAYTFIFSPRVGTPAEKLEDLTSIEEKEQRLYKLNEIVNKYFLESNQKLLGKVVDVLVDGKSEKEGMLCGYTDTNKLINFYGDESLIGKIVKVEVTDAKTWSLDGKAK
jgi:tRNA-2-methylthio-N6-dimethylallyladenosine synthase